MKVEGKEKMMKHLTKMQLRSWYVAHYFPGAYLHYPKEAFPLWPSMVQDMVWETVPDLPWKRRALSAASLFLPSLQAPAIYAIGGEAEIEVATPQKTETRVVFQKTTDMYSPQTGIWQEMAPMNSPRIGFAAVAAGGKIYAIGGDWQHWEDTGWVSDTVEEYDPAANTWTTKPNEMLHPMDLFGAAATSDGKIWVIGGWDGPPNYTISGRVHCYDTSTDSWEEISAQMPTPRIGLAVVAAGNPEKIYAIGGEFWHTFGVCTQPVGTVEEFNPVTREWTPKKDMLTPRSWLAAVAASNGKIYAMGGLLSNSALSIVEEYDPSTDTWQTANNPMNTARYQFGAAATDDGKIYAIGGATITSPSDWSLLSSVEVVTVPYGPVHTGNTGSNSGSVNLTHGTYVLVVVDVAYNRDTMGDPTVTVGGTAAAQVGVGTDADKKIACASYVCYRPAAGTDSVAASFSGSGSWCMTAQGVTGTTTAAYGPFTETVVTGGANSGTSIALNVGAGTAGRRVHMAVCVNNNGPTAPASGQIEVDDYPVPGDGRSVESNYRDIDGAVTMDASWSNGARNAGIAYGILRSP
jgi:N-acetylneuraminic acid mutarotase